MSDMEQPNPPSPVDPAGQQDQPRARSKRGAGKRGGRPNPEGGDQTRQQRSRPERAVAGFGDGIERAICLGVISHLPRSFPVQHRTGVATKQYVEIARTETSSLYCNGEHRGPCIWPNGDIVGDKPHTAVPSDSIESD
jgi:hypothetical protein